MQVDINEINDTILDRLSSAFTSHWMYTGIAGVGLYGLISKQINTILAVILLIIPLVLHFLWNSPINSDELSFVLSIITIIIFLLVTIKMIKLNKVNSNNNLLKNLN